MQPEEITEAPPTVDPDLPTPSPEPLPESGDPIVDEVLVSVSTLDDLPLEEHVAVFEQAHDRLRRALDARPDN